MALYVLFAGLLALSGIVEQIGMDTGSGSGQNNSGLLLLYLMPLISAVWGHEAATILIQQANKMAPNAQLMIEQTESMALANSQRFTPEARALVMRALELEPDNLDYLYALADFYLKRNKLQEAKSIAKEMVTRHPNQRIGHDILGLIEKNVEPNPN